MVERTLPKPDTRVRFPSAAPQAFCPTAGGFLFWVVWVEAVCSLLLQGTRPRSASDTLMSRRNIPTSPLPLFPSPGRWSSGCGCRGRGANRGLLGLGRVCGNGEGEYWGEVPQAARRETKIGSRVWWWFRRDVRAPSRGLIKTGLVVAPYERAAQLYLPEATSGCPSSARAGAPVGAKEVYSVPSAHTSQRLKDVQLTTQLC